MVLLALGLWKNASSPPGVVVMVSRHGAVLLLAQVPLVLRISGKHWNWLQHTDHYVSRKHVFLHMLCWASERLANWIRLPL